MANEVKDKFTSSNLYEWLTNSSDLHELVSFFRWNFYFAAGHFHMIKRAHLSPFDAVKNIIALTMTSAIPLSNHLSA